MARFAAKAFFCYNLSMTTDEKLESLIQQAAELSDDDQAELFQSLVAIRAQNLGVYDLEDDERSAPARSAE